MATPFVIAAAFTIPARRIADMFCGAIESGFCSWLGKVEPPETTWSRPEGFTTPFYDDESFVASKDFKFTVHYDQPEDAEGDMTGKKVIDHTAIWIGLTLMAQFSAKHFADLLAENDDAVTQDVFMQYVVLGEIVYG